MAGDGSDRSGEDGVRVAKVRLPDVRTQGIRPRPLCRLDRTKRAPALGRDAKVLSSTVPWVLFVEAIPLFHQDIRHALNTLTGQAPTPGDLGDGRGPVIDRGQHPPSCTRLASRLGQRVTCGHQQPIQPEDVDDELAEGVASERPGSSARSHIDSILSISIGFGS
jgi:hypothetical protein